MSGTIRTGGLEVCFQPGKNDTAESLDALGTALRPDGRAPFPSRRDGRADAIHSPAGTTTRRIAVGQGAAVGPEHTASTSREPAHGFRDDPQGASLGSPLGAVSCLDAVFPKVLGLASSWEVAAPLAGGGPGLAAA